MAEAEALCGLGLVWFGASGAVPMLHPDWAIMSGLALCIVAALHIIADAVAGGEDV